MVISPEYYELMENRESMYQLLSRFFIAEIDESLFQHLKKTVFPTETGIKEINEGYRYLERYLKNPGTVPITELAVDFARVFLGAGVYEGTVANPYESVYTSPARLIMQDARDEVLAAYRAKGLDKRESLNVPEDHISLEFEFMAFMCREALEAFDTEDWQKISGSLAEQKDFLDRHLLNWIPEFCEDIEKCSSTDFYLGIAKITNGFLQMEKSILEELVSEAVFDRAYPSFEGS